MLFQLIFFNKIIAESNLNKEFVDLSAQNIEMAFQMNKWSWYAQTNPFGLRDS